jgi:predicted transcriptional regulator
MACINPDGSLTRPGRALVAALQRPKNLAQASNDAGIPLYRVRSVIRELLEAKLVAVEGDIYKTTELGLEKIADR